MNAPLRQAPPHGALIWSCVEDGFYVASCGNEFLGFVDRISTDRFQVCNAKSEQVGLFATLQDAQNCLISILPEADASAARGAEE